MNIAILGSTKGRSSQLLLEKIKNGELKGITVSFILSNKKDALILERAKENNINGIFLDEEGKTREDFDNEIDKLLTKNNVELVLLIGYMKILSKGFVEKWGNKTMNIHPSLLPSFIGGIYPNTHKAALARGCKVSGCTLMFIDEGADTGPIIMQSVVQVANDETPDTLKAKVQQKEQEAILKAVELFRDGKISLVGNKVTILP